MFKKKLSWLVLPVFSLWLSACGAPAEDCANAADDDGDGAFDCDDTDCQNVSFCVIQENCNTPGDEDNNGAADCDDSVCAALPQCQASCGDGNVNAGEQCDGNNLNGNSCASLGFTGGNLSCNGNCFFDTLGCVTTGACGDGILQAALGEECDNGLDNGTPNDPCAADCTLVGGGACGDGTIDAGEDCDGNNLGGASCVSEGFDSGALGCDANCGFDFAGCVSNNPVCGNGLQEVGEQCDGNDLNGQSCQSFGFDSGVLACTNNGTCAFDQSDCANTGNGENCTNGIDDDGDNLIDCSPNGPDANCDCAESCTAPTVVTDPSTVQGDTTGHGNSRTGTCVGANAPDVAFQVTIATTGNLELILDSQEDLGMFVRTTCNQNTEIGGNACVDQEAGGQLEVLSVPVTAGQTVFIIVDGFFNQQTGIAGEGPFSLSVESVVDANPEQCTNNVDDNGDNAVDCNDADCTAACGEACAAPPSIGEGVTTGSTTGHATNRRGTCDGSVNAQNQQINIGPDVAFAFTAPQAGTLTATLTSGFDAILYARGTCEQQATELDCADNAAANQNETISFNVTAGQTVFLFVDGFTNTQGVTGSGPFSLNVDLQ